MKNSHYQYVASLCRLCIEKNLIEYALCVCVCQGGCGLGGHQVSGQQGVGRVASQLQDEAASLGRPEENQSNRAAARRAANRPASTHCHRARVRHVQRAALGHCAPLRAAAGAHQLRVRAPVVQTPLRAHTGSKGSTFDHSFTILCSCINELVNKM